jgi:signal transduction histidine kinase
LAQAVANLLNNAAKYTKEGGRIGLLVEREKSEVYIRVRDDGMGISAELLPKVFDLFNQADATLHRSQGGLGIGLSLVRQVVVLHGGKVDAFSKGPGQGSEFLIRLPLLPCDQPMFEERGCDGNRPITMAP